VRPETEIRETY